MSELGSPPHRVLILFAHPALERSRVNRVLVDEVRGLEGITLHDLYEAYPDLDIDVPREQALLDDHDVVVMQHPLFWYSTPAILKEWQDLVLQHGWAYGTQATALHGKVLVSAVTTGGKMDAYHRDGYNRYTVRELLTPISQTGRLCGMISVAPFIAHGALKMPQERLRQHALEYRELLEALRDGTLDLEKAAAPDVRYLNQDLTSLLRESV